MTLESRFDGLAQTPSTAYGPTSRILSLLNFTIPPLTRLCADNAASQQKTSPCHWVYCPVLPSLCDTDGVKLQAVCRLLRYLSITLASVFVWRNHIAGKWSPENKRHPPSRFYSLFSLRRACEIMRCRMVVAKAGFEWLRLFCSSESSKVPTSTA